MTHVMHLIIPCRLSFLEKFIRLRKMEGKIKGGGGGATESEMGLLIMMMDVPLEELKD